MQPVMAQTLSGEWDGRPASVRGNVPEQSIHRRMRTSNQIDKIPNRLIDEL